jgi:hypothetical protein
VPKKKAGFSALLCIGRKDESCRDGGGGDGAMERAVPAASRQEGTTLTGESFEMHSFWSIRFPCANCFDASMLTIGHGDLPDAFSARYYRLLVKLIGSYATIAWPFGAPRNFLLTAGNKFETRGVYSRSFTSSRLGLHMFEDSMVESSGKLKSKSTSLHVANGRLQPGYRRGDDPDPAPLP